MTIPYKNYLIGNWIALDHTSIQEAIKGFGAILQYQLSCIDTIIHFHKFWAHVKELFLLTTHFLKFEVVVVSQKSATRIC